MTTRFILQKKITSSCISRSSVKTQLRIASNNRLSYPTAALSTLSTTINGKKTSHGHLQNSSLFFSAALMLAGSAITWNKYTNEVVSNEALSVSSSLEDLKTSKDLDEKTNYAHDEDDTTELLNWSGTHKIEVSNDRYHQPESIDELESIVQKCYTSGTPIRPLGSALSPNGIGFHSSGMISLAYLDEIINVDKENMTVTVQSGARVSQVIEALRTHEMTLPNLASIAEQQMGGFIQVGAHGTGALIAPVDEYVTQLSLITPTKETITIKKGDPLFTLAKVGLGCLGVVSEITMQCIPAHKLVEHTYVLTRAEAKAQIQTLLKKHKHIRYMWVPYQDAVVVVTNDPEEEMKETANKIMSEPTLSKEEKGALQREQLKPFTELLLELTNDPIYKGETYTNEAISEMGFGELRDALLAINPLDVDHVKLCNAAEASFWKNSQGYQIKPSDQLLQFDCGGQQWVWEVCFPTGTYENNNNNDMDFMENLLEGIEKGKIAAHSPIEQRWSASSSSKMSPAHGPPEGLHCWVGIIMYLPSDQEDQRKEITNAFKGPYCDLLKNVGRPVSATSHWAKQEMPNTAEELIILQQFMKTRFPVEEFNEARKQLDDKNLLANDLMNSIFGSTNNEIKEE